MCMSMTHRLQLLLDEERYQKVAAVAALEKRSVASVIREAIDRSVSGPRTRRQAAATAILAAEPVDVPDVSDLRSELDQLRGRHG